ncbi:MULTISPECIES: hypothetical protein [Prauserella]|uniref:Uncharacterized protein n=1 Tax=Prauserella flavalba TaxID=1477506 RepID=A0A318L9U9_9PSEU|nr:MULTISPECIES: hypothetical protein [Prauserella]PXY16782.1 hypothetical protein BAY59_38090 [Prauserella coralliicola]PXY17483.1 hypothetical protein BA062_37505 [Prauserella flavalba]
MLTGPAIATRHCGAADERGGDQKDPARGISSRDTGHICEPAADREGSQATGLPDQVEAAKMRPLIAGGVSGCSNELK